MPLENIYFFFSSFEYIVSASALNQFTKMSLKQNHNFGLFHSSFKQQKRGIFSLFLGWQLSKLQKSGLLWFWVCSSSPWWRHRCWNTGGGGSLNTEGWEGVSEREEAGGLAWGRAEEEALGETDREAEFCGCLCQHKVFEVTRQGER